MSSKLIHSEKPFFSKMVVDAVSAIFEVPCRFSERITRRGGYWRAGAVNDARSLLHLDMSILSMST